ncbi:MAG: hypothetical protein IPK55_14875 [Streptococcus sp.]|nr:hypothetical protein [Streptococcus sp.]
MDKEKKKMIVIRYSEHSFGSMANLEARVKNVKNVTELKKVRKDITAYMRLMSNMQPGRRLPKNFRVVGFAKVTFLDIFPISNCYEITIEEGEESGDNHE